MDREGSDVHFIVSNGGPGHPDPDIEMEFIAAHHRYLDAFCGADPRRLKSSLTVTPLSVEKSVAEIPASGPAKKPWVVGGPSELCRSIIRADHPDLHPIWAAAQDQGWP